MSKERELAKRTEERDLRSIWASSAVLGVQAAFIFEVVVRLAGRLDSRDLGVIGASMVWGAIVGLLVWTIFSMVVVFLFGRRHALDESMILYGEIKKAHNEFFGEIALIVNGILSREIDAALEVERARAGSVRENDRRKLEEARVRIVQLIKSRAGEPGPYNLHSS